MLQLETTGRAVLIGGSGLVLALGLVAVIGPTELMVSVGAAALTSAAFATGAAVVVMPAALVLFGRRIDTLELPRPAIASPYVGRLVGGGNWVTRHASVRGLRRDRAAGRARDPGVRARRWATVGQRTSSAREGAHRFPGGLARDGARMGDAVQRGRRRSQPPDHHPGAAHGSRAASRLRSRRTRPSTPSSDRARSTTTSNQLKKFGPSLDPLREGLEPE